MATKLEEVTRCDKCHREGNGASPDCVYCLRCGHDICDECYGRHVKKMGSITCPVCGEPYVVGRGEDPDDDKVMKVTKAAWEWLYNNGWLRLEHDTPIPYANPPTGLNAAIGEELEK